MQAWFLELSGKHELTLKNDRSNNVLKTLWTKTIEPDRWSGLGISSWAVLFLHDIPQTFKGHELFMYLPPFSRSFFLSFVQSVCLVVTSLFKPDKEYTFLRKPHCTSVNVLDPSLIECHDWERHWITLWSKLQHIGTTSSVQWALSFIRSPSVALHRT